MRRKATIVGYVLLFASIPIGLSVGYALVALFPDGAQVPGIILIAPAAPIVVIAWLFLHAGGETEGAKAERGIRWTAYAGGAATLFLVIWFVFPACPECTSGALSAGKIVAGAVAGAAAGLLGGAAGAGADAYASRWIIGGVRMSVAEAVVFTPLGARLGILSGFAMGGLGGAVGDGIAPTVPMLGAVGLVYIGVHRMTLRMMGEVSGPSREGLDGAMIGAGILGGIGAYLGRSIGGG